MITAAVLTITALGLYMVKDGTETLLINRTPSAVLLTSVFIEGFLLGILSYKGILTCAVEGLDETKCIKDNTTNFFIKG